MRILVVNLLRIGDIISTLPALKKFRLDHPTAQIDLLINSSFAHMVGVIGYVDRVLLFDRDAIQKSLVDAERPLFEGYDLLKETVDGLNEQGYDRIVNFTHNRLSGWLCGLIQAGEKHGLVFDGTGAVSFGDPWFRFLNAQVDIDSGHAINHSDIFLGAAAGWSAEPNRTFFDSLLSETDRGRAECEALLRSALVDGPRLVLQLSTSDQKKEWGDDRFRALVHRLSSHFPRLTVFVLGAPNEVKRIRMFCEDLNATDSAHETAIIPAVVSLEGAVSLLEESDILVTGDTSIKHLAAAASIPIVELSLGSADVFRTGSWKAGDIIVSSKEPCAPCGHSELCHRASHLCAEGLPAELIAELVIRRMQSPQLLAREHREALRQFAKLAEVHVVDRSEGPAHPLPLFAELTDVNLASLLERTARCISVEMQSGRFSEFDFGSAIRRAAIVLRKQFFDESDTDLRHILSLHERELRHAEGLLQSLRLQIARVKENYQDPGQLKDVIRSCISTQKRLRQSAILSFASEALAAVVEDDRSAPFTRLRKMIDAIEELERRQMIVVKLCRGLETQTFDSFESERFEGNK